MQAILQVEKLSKRFGEHLLFEDISFGIGMYQKTALIAKNGKGKSTLLKIIAGEESPDTGTVIFRNGITLGYLAQDPELNPENHVFEEVFNADTPVLRLIKAYEKAVADNDQAALEELLPQMDSQAAWDYEHLVKQIISRLKVDTYRQPIRTLSGGQRKRVGLAKVLISNPDFLLLDEPTNHLDMESITALKNGLIKFPGVLLFSSRDHQLVQTTANRIMEIGPGGKLIDKITTYDEYLESDEMARKRQVYTMMESDEEDN